MQMKVLPEEPKYRQCEEKSVVFIDPILFTVQIFTSEQGNHVQRQIIYPPSNLKLPIDLEYKQTSSGGLIEMFFYLFAGLH